MTNKIREQLKVPAIGLLIAGILNLLAGGYLVLSVGIQFAMGYANRAFASDYEMYGFFAGFIGTGVFGLLGLLTAPVIIFGAIQMLNGNKYGTAKFASILAIIPATGCCFPISIPFGIWSFFALRKPGVEEHFGRTE